jgi:hypothetical protein
VLPALEEFEDARMFLEFFASSGAIQISGVVTSLTYIPEPGTGVLLGLGLGLVAAARRR